MLAQQQHGGQVMFPAGAGPAGLHQSPPSSTGGFLLLPNHGQQRPGDSGGSPNSTPGLQTPTPAATPPIMNLGMDQERGGLFLQGGPGGRVMQLGQHELQQELAQADFGEQMMAWRGLQALSGGTLADMFPPMDRGMPGMGMGGPGGQVRCLESKLSTETFASGWIQQLHYGNGSSCPGSASPREHDATPTGEDKYMK